MHLALRRARRIQISNTYVTKQHISKYKIILVVNKVSMGSILLKLKFSFSFASFWCTTKNIVFILYILTS